MLIWLQNNKLTCFMKISGTWTIVYENILCCVSLRDEYHFRPALLFPHLGPSDFGNIVYHWKDRASHVWDRAMRFIEIPLIATIKTFIISKMFTQIHECNATKEKKYVGCCRGSNPRSQDINKTLIAIPASVSTNWANLQVNLHRN